MKQYKKTGWLLAAIWCGCQHTSPPNVPNRMGGLVAHPATEKLLLLTGLTYDGSLPDLVRTTQAGWLRKGESSLSRPPVKKWDTKPFIPLFQELDLVADQPLRTSTGELRKNVQMEDCLLAGAYVFSMVDRLHFLHTTMEAQQISCKRLVALAGDRDIDPHHEGKEVFTYMRSQFPWFQYADAELDQAWATLRNEHDLAQFILTQFQRTHPKAFSEVRYVNAPKKKTKAGTWTRPTTADTLREYMQRYQPKGEILLVTSQPFGFYMHTLAQKIFEKSPVPLHVSTIAGHSFFYDMIPTNVYLDYLARTFYVLTHSESEL
jgi:hypothetical protein